MGKLQKFLSLQLEGVKHKTVLDQKQESFSRYILILQVGKIKKKKEKEKNDNIFLEQYLPVMLLSLFIPL